MPKSVSIGTHALRALGEQHVGGLEVPVHDAVGVARGERVGDLGRDQRGRHGRERAVLAQVAVEVRPVDQVHHEGEQIALDDQVPRADDVVVRQPEQDGALPEEAHDHIGVVRQLLLEDLDRDRLAGLPGHGRLGSRRLPLAGPPDGARGAAAQRLLEQVLAAYRPHVMRSLVSYCNPAHNSAVSPTIERPIENRGLLRGETRERDRDGCGRARTRSRRSPPGSCLGSASSPSRGVRCGSAPDRRLVGRRRWTARARPLAHGPRQSRSLGDASGTRCQ